MPTASGISSTPETVTGCVSPNAGSGSWGSIASSSGSGGSDHCARHAGSVGRATGPLDLPPGHVEQGLHRRQGVDVLAAQQRGEDPGAAGEHDDHHRGSGRVAPSVADHRARGSPGTSTRPRPGKPGSACSMNAKNCRGVHVLGERRVLDDQLAGGMDEGPAGRAPAAGLVTGLLEPRPGILDEHVRVDGGMGSGRQHGPGHGGQRRDQGPDDEGPAYPPHRASGYAAARREVQRRRGRRLRTGISRGTGRRGPAALAAAHAAAAAAAALAMAQITRPSLPLGPRRCWSERTTVVVDFGSCPNW